MNRIPLIIILVLFWACQEEVDIAQFEDEFGEYESELRIEAILDPVNPENSIVRIDRTILVTDTSIFNGRDDDGDWDPLTDDVGEDGIIGVSDGFGPPKDKGEGNGKPDQGEPHVDEYDEVLPLLHDSTATIALVEAGTVGGQVIDFVWMAIADSFKVLAIQVEPGFVSPEELEWEFVTYGAYRPVAGDYTIDYGQEYEFQISSGDRLITGPVKPLRPPTFFVDDHTPDADTLRIELNESSRFRWTTEPDATVTWVTVELVLGPDSLQLVTTHPAGPTDQAEDGSWIGEDILSLYFPGLYRWTVVVPNRAYGAYFYSDLPMRDEQLSNLRDDEGRVILGIAGSSAPNIQYVRLIEAPGSP